MTAEEIFIRDAAAFFDDPVIFTDAVKNKLLFLLAEYKERIPAIVVTNNVEKERIVYLKAVKSVGTVNQQALIDKANELCAFHGITFNEFMYPKKGKSTWVITEIRREFCDYIITTYGCAQEVLRAFFNVNHSTIVYYVNYKKKPKKYLRDAAGNQ